MINLKKLSLPVVALLLSLLANAQQFQYRSNLDTVTSSGFYAIPITPELSSHLKTDFSDFRIVDGKGQWVPHLMRFSDIGTPSPETPILPIATNDEDPVKTVVLILNQEKLLLNEFVLRVVNSSAQRMASLSGSNDDKNWFIIADSLLVSRSEAFGKDEELKRVSFPPTQYSFYKLTIRNDRKDPLNILQVTTTFSDIHTSDLVKNPSPVFSRVDSGKLTLIKVTYEQPYQIDHFRLSVTRPILYARAARIYLEVRPGLMNTWESPSITELILSSNDLREQSTPLIKAKTFYILISNNDNPPLEINAVNTFQRNSKAIAYLEKGKSYHLLLDNPRAEQPDYDFRHFDKRIPERPAVLGAGPLVSIGLATIDSSKKIGDWWIWATIGGVILILAYLTWGLTKDMNKKKEIV